MPKLDGISAAEKIAEESIAPVLMLTAFSQRDLVERARDAGAMAYLVKPFSKSDVVPAIEMAVSRFTELKALEKEIEDLTTRLETRKLVDRAKSVLQTEYGLSEPAAFRWIQKTSMDRRMSMQQVAEAVIPGRRPEEGREGLSVARREWRVYAWLRPAPRVIGCGPQPYARSRVRVDRLSPRRGTPCGPIRRAGGPGRIRRGRCCRPP